jgi:hypothetical protein
VKPSVSVLVATIEPWPAVQACLERLLPQVNAAGGELILADGTPDASGAPPPLTNSCGSLRTIASPGASVLALRARAADASHGPFLAFTEDHCVVGERWVSSIVAAHETHPHADMVSGPVMNGSPDGIMDWANFIMTFAEFMPPAPSRRLKRTPPMSNASFRRSILLGGPLPEGWLELVKAPMLLHSGRLHYDNDIVVSHVQPRGWRSALAAHFHNGRASAGLVLPHIARRDWWLRLATVPVMPGILFVSVLRSLRGRAVPARAIASLPAMFLLCLAHASGETAGLLSGEGSSARRLN